MTPPRVTRVRPAGDQHEVLSVEGRGEAYRRRPCSGCPWRVDQTGVFPAEAFVHSAETAYDMAGRTFACHEHGVDHPMTCAGFLLRGPPQSSANATPPRTTCARSWPAPARAPSVCCTSSSTRPASRGRTGEPVPPG